MNSDIKKLPMIIPTIETYQGVAFVMAILLTHDNIREQIHNSYVDIRCVNSNRIWDLTLELTDVLWDSMCEENIFELDLFHAKNLSPDYFVPFLKERIDQGNYLLFYKIDEYYLSHSIEYKKRHFIHDIYIYGYELDEFCVMAYKDGKLQLFNINQSEIVEGFFACNNHVEEEEVHFCTCRPNERINIKVDYERLKSYIAEYTRGKKRDEYLYGTYIYLAIKDCLRTMIETKGRGKLDIRVLRMLWEHKILMIEHLEKLGDVVNVEDALSCAREVECLGNKVFRLALKYSVTESNKILEKMIDIIAIMEIIEKKYLTELVSSFV